MKLRNKRSGEIVKVVGFDQSYDEIKMRFVNEKNEGRLYVTGSLTTLNSDWEDYVEPNNYWSIDCFSPDGLISEFTGSSSDVLENRKSIGNYFETKEEAKEAVQKLKAWKRLKDKGFVFNGVNKYDGSIKTGISKKLDISKSVEFYEDMTLLFGGEE